MQVLTKEKLKLISKLNQKKFRQMERKFVIEGFNLIEECIKSGFYRNNLEMIILREDVKYNNAVKKIFTDADYPEVFVLKKSEFKKLSNTVNSQGILGIVKFPEFNSERFEITSGKMLIVLLDGINDPGNLGTIIRNCYWFGVNELMIGKNSADVFNPKVVRSSQGALFNMRIRDNADIDKELLRLLENKFIIYITDLNAKQFSDEVNFRKHEKIAFVFGNESAGVSENLLHNENYNKIKIRGYSNCESLNVAVSTGIILNEYKKSCSGFPEQL